MSQAAHYSLPTKADTAETLSVFLHEKFDTRSPTAAAAPSLMESAQTPSPIGPHNALLSRCPPVMAVPRYNAPPPFLSDTQLCKY